MSAYCSVPLNPDRAVFLVLCRYKSGLAFAERDLARTCRNDTIEDIRTGQFPEVVQVIEINTAEFSSRDVTEEILVEANDELPAFDRPAERQAAAWDHARGYRNEVV